MPKPNHTSLDSSLQLNNNRSRFHDLKHLGHGTYRKKHNPIQNVQEEYVKIQEWGRG